MAQNYAAKYTDKIDERFRLKSVTEAIINKGMRLDFNGVSSVTIYNVDVPTEGNYNRTSTNRFGSVAELGTGKQTFVLSQDKAFTFSIDRGNLEDSMMVQEAGSALQRTLDEVCIPNTDIYRLSVLQAYAVANSQSATAALSASNVFTKILDAQAVLDNAKVPIEGRFLFVPPATANFLKLDTNFIKASDRAQGMLVANSIGEVDGTEVVKVPVSYLPSNTGFLLVHKKTLVAPHKFDTYRTLSDVQGIDGWVVEGRRYYDAFIPNNAGDAIYAHMNS